MLVLSVGMPRAGSGWRFNLIHDLVVAAGGEDAHNIRRRYGLTRLLNQVNLNISTLKPHRLLPVMLPALLGKTYAINTHAGPTALARWLIKKGWLRASYIYRDPRATLLSTYEYGRRRNPNYSAREFLQLESIDQAIEHMKGYVEICEQWLAVEGVLHARYEDVLTHYDQEVERLLALLDIQEVDEPVRQVIERYRPEQAPKDHPGLHFQKGEPERFRQVLTEEQLEAATQAFAPFLERMGYEL